jgi:hypothetical protein
VPDLNEGITVGGEPAVPIEEGDVRTQAGFDARLAEAAARARGEEPETPAVEPAAGEQQPTPEPATQTPPEGGGEQPEGEAPNEWQVRYEEAQKLIGRMGQELGELRSAQQRQPEPEYDPVSTAPGEIEGMVEEHGPQAVMQWAIQEEARGNAGLIDEVLDAWFDVDPKEARRFEREYIVARTAPAPSQPAPLDPALQKIVVQNKWDAMRVQAATGEDGAVDQTLARAINDVLVDPETPDTLRAMIVSGDDNTMQAALPHLVWGARLRVASGAYVGASAPAEQGGQSSAEQAAAAAEAARKAESQAAKRSTAIVSGARSLAPAGEQPDTEEQTRRREALARFKQSIFDAPSTDISSGLTVNGNRVAPDLKLVP